jgi:predicted DNA-binding protein
LLDTVKEAIEDGRATVEDLEEWLLAAILLEEMALDEEQDRQDARVLDTWLNASTTLH